ncbi:hypothetical protein FSP39_022812 [Pinctada imbricata]|uniref:Uncharacterized protein n=1 Tax=Pinctada imbricata TaxID=66713 RepID=A0AA88Y9L6_PINIB|nr:hypothetical protein FSP39_022812 [Pinctada imbricata]
MCCPIRPKSVSKFCRLNSNNSGGLRSAVLKPALEKVFDFGPMPPIVLENELFDDRRPDRPRILAEMGNAQGGCSACCIRQSQDNKQEEVDLEAQGEELLDEDVSGIASALPPRTVTLRDDEIQKIVDVWNRKQREREERDDSVLNPEHQFSIALLMNDESLAKRLLHHISDEEILSKLYHDPLSKPEVKQVIIERAREIAAKRFGLSNSFVGHRVSSKDGKYNIQSVIVGFSAWTSNVKIRYVMGIAVEIRNYRYVNDEAERVEKVRRKSKDELTDPETEVLRGCIRKYSTRLWRRHSNLNIISACSIKSKNNGKEMKRQPCIVLYCSVKGVIPYLEKPFPKLLHSLDGQDVPVDVREGYFQFAGSTIENESEGRTSARTETPMQKTFPVFTSELFKTRALNKEGTVGPFVELSEGKTGFITCAHSVFDCSRQTEFSFPQDNVLPNDISISIKLEENDKLEDREIQCKVVEAVFTTRSEDKSKREPSLDAAIVELPDNLVPECEMKILSNSQIVQCGYDDADFVEFRTGELIKRMTDNFRKFEVLKCGAQTGLTIGAFKLNGIQLKHSDFRFTSNGKPWTFDSHYQIMQGQYEISSRSDETFIGPGDSGASVYVKGRFGELYLYSHHFRRTGLKVQELARALRLKEVHREESLLLDQRHLLDQSPGAISADLKQSPSQRIPLSEIKVQITQKKTTKSTVQKLQPDNEANSKPAWNKTASKRSSSETKEVDPKESMDSKQSVTESGVDEIGESKDPITKEQTSNLKTTTSEVFNTHVKTTEGVSEKHESNDQTETEPVSFSRYCGTSNNRRQNFKTN